MVVEERVGTLAIVTNGSAGYLVVEILGEAKTFEEAQEILDTEMEEEENEEGEEDEDYEDDED